MAVSAVKKEPASAPEEAKAPAAEAKPKISKKKLVISLGVLIVSVAAGGGGYWYSTKDHGGPSQEAKSQPAKPPMFVPLEAFTVNLQVEDTPQFAQVGLTLKVADSSVADALKVYMPEVRDRILRLLSSRKASELLTLDGKQKLSNDIVTAVNAVLAPANLKLASDKPAAGDEPADAAAENAPAEDAQGDGKEAADTPEKAEKNAADTPPAAAEKAKPEATVTRAVQSVLFTSFVIQ